MTSMGSTKVNQLQVRPSIDQELLAGTHLSLGNQAMASGPKNIKNDVRIET